MIDQWLRRAIAALDFDALCMPYNHPVERTSHSVDSVPMRGSVPVGRRSPEAFGTKGEEERL
jgi:hypothetical protein